VIVKDSSGALLFEAFLHGVGITPQVALAPGLLKSFIPSLGFDYIRGVVVDPAGYIFVADSTADVIERINPADQSNIVYAGTRNYSPGNTGDGGPATSANLQSAGDIALDGAGNLYIASGNVVRKIDGVTGIISTVAGGGTNTVQAGMPATTANLGNITSLAVDSAGNLYLSESAYFPESALVIKVDAAAGTISIVAGSQSNGASYGDGGAATSAALGSPVGLALDSAANLYIADSSYHVVRKVDLSTDKISTVAGTPSQAATGAGMGDGSPATSANLQGPNAVALDPAGDIYISDGAVVRKVSAATGIISTVAGSATTLVNPYGNIPLDGYPANSVTLPSSYLALDGSGNLYVGSYEIVTNASALFFGQTAVGTQSTPLTLTVQNTGTDTLQIAGTQLPANSNFVIQDTVTTDCSRHNSLTAGDSCTVSVAFTPTQSGAVASTLTVTDNNLGQTGAQQQVALRSPWGQAALSVPSLDFGSRYVGSFWSSNFTITNSGNLPVTLTLALQGANAGDFSYPTYICSGFSAPYTIAAQSSCTISVNFQPTAAGARTASLIITDSADASPQTVTLTGTALAAAQPQLSLNVTSLHFDGTSGPQVVTVTNSGSGILYFRAFLLNGAYHTGFFLSDGCINYEIGGLAPGTSCNITVSFTPPVSGGVVDWLMLNNNAPNSPQSVTLSGSGSSPGTNTPLLFVPVTPCRIADTRNANGPLGGPELAAASSRDFAIPASACGIPPTAAAYSLNVTAVPSGPLGFLSIWPTGQPQPWVSTLNSDGRAKANAAIVPAGTNGSISVYVSNASHVVLDINGYFVPAGNPGGSGLAFFPLIPCRIADTRQTGGPLLAQTRDFAVTASPCNVPSSAVAYSLNFTAIPRGSLGYLSTWPAGQNQPLVSTLNAASGAVTANAAIVPAGANGDILVYSSDKTDVAIDINGYFAPQAAGGLSLFTLTPCRVLDTRNGPQPEPVTGTSAVNITKSSCNVPSNAQAVVLNSTVVSPGALGFLSLWPTGQSQPWVSTLNAEDGAVTSNMAIVPVGNGSVNAYASDPTHLILDISSYFAP